MAQLYLNWVEESWPSGMQNGARLAIDEKAEKETFRKFSHAYPEFGTAS